MEQQPSGFMEKIGFIGLRTTNLQPNANGNHNTRKPWRTALRERAARVQTNVLNMGKMS